MFRAKFITNNNPNIGYRSIDSNWISMKKIFSTGLKMYGERLAALEKISQNVIQEMCVSIERENGEFFEPMEHLHDAVTNIMASVVC